MSNSVPSSQRNFTSNESLAINFHKIACLITQIAFDLATAHPETVSTLQALNFAAPGHAGIARDDGHTNFAVDVAENLFRTIGNHAQSQTISLPLSELHQTLAATSNRNNSPASAQLASLLRNSGFQIALQTALRSKKNSWGNRTSDAPIL